MIGGEQPNAADLQIGAGLRLLLTIDDVAAAVRVAARRRSWRSSGSRGIRGACRWRAAGRLVDAANVNGGWVGGGFGCKAVARCRLEPLRGLGGTAAAPHPPLPSRSCRSQAATRNGGPERRTAWPGPARAAHRRPATRPAASHPASPPAAAPARTAATSPPRAAAAGARTQNETSPSSSTSTSIGRGPWRTPPALPPQLPLDRLARVEQRLGLQRRLDPHDRVEELRLVEHLADRLGVVDRRRRQHPHADAPAARRPRPGGAPAGRRRSSRARGGRITAGCARSRAGATARAGRRPRSTARRPPPTSRPRRGGWRTRPSTHGCSPAGHAGRRAPVDGEVDGRDEGRMLHVREGGRDPGVGERGEQHRVGRRAARAARIQRADVRRARAGASRSWRGTGTPRLVLEALDLPRPGHVRALELVPLRLALAPGAAAAEPVGDGHAVLQHPQRRERRRATRALDRRHDLELARHRRRRGSAASASAARGPRRRRPRSARASRARRRGRRSGPRWTNQCSRTCARQRPSAPVERRVRVERVRHAAAGRSRTARSAGAAAPAASAPTSSSRPAAASATARAARARSSRRSAPRARSRRRAA